MCVDIMLSLPACCRFYAPQVFSTFGSGRKASLLNTVIIGAGKSPQATGFHPGFRIAPVFCTANWAACADGVSCVARSERGRHPRRHHRRGPLGPPHSVHLLRPGHGRLRDHRRRPARLLLPRQSRLPPRQRLQRGPGRHLHLRRQLCLVLGYATRPELGAICEAESEPCCAFFGALHALQALLASQLW